MDNTNSNEQQAVPADQALVMAIDRLKGAKIEVSAAESNLFALSDQVTKEVIKADYKNMKDKIEQLESIPESMKEVAKK